MSIKRTRRKTKIRSGSRTVTVSNTLAIQADQIARDLAPDLSRVMSHEMSMLYDGGTVSYTHLTLPTNREV